MSAIFTLIGFVFTLLALWKSHEGEKELENIFLWFAVAAISIANLLD